MRAGEMWNSNSVIAWLLACSGGEMDRIRPPISGRAPGWEAGIGIARRHHPTDVAAPSPLASAAGDGAAFAGSGGVEFRTQRPLGSRERRA